MNSSRTTDIFTHVQNSTPVVVLKLSHHLGLGLVRSLGRLGITMYGIDQDRWAPGMNSRYCHETFIWDVDKASPEATAQYLLKIGKKIGKRSLLFHTADESAHLLAEYARELEEWFIFPHQSPKLVDALASKKEMYFLAKEHCIPTAETLFPQTRDEVVQFLDRVSFPIMLKGIDGQRLEQRTGKKMVIINTPDDLLSHYDWMEDPEHPNLMLQEYIPGGDDTVWMFNGYFNRESECLVAFTGKKIRQAPVYTGYTSLGICLKNEAVEETTKSFMKKIGYKGILDIGYRYDARDGKYKVLDINPRIGATFRLFVADNGMDVARAAYLDLTGQHVPLSTTQEGRKWFVEDRDVVSCIRYYRDKKLTVSQWLRSFKGVQEAAYFAADDLVPFCVMCGQQFRKLFQRSQHHARAFLPLIGLWGSGNISDFS
jgi:D-aspartate ligase